MSRVLLLAMAVVPLLMPRGVCLCRWLPVGCSATSEATAADAVPHCCANHADAERDPAPAAPPTCRCGELEDLSLAAPQTVAEAPPPEALFAALPACVPPPSALPRGVEALGPPRPHVPIYISVRALLL